MLYESLTKIYYKDEKNHYKEYQKRYNAPFAFHLNVLIKQYNNITK